MRSAASGDLDALPESQGLALAASVEKIVVAYGAGGARELDVVPCGLNEMLEPAFVVSLEQELREHEVRLRERGGARGERTQGL